MSGKSIAIIGAGIAGLAAGCYAQMNGYQSRIFELHNKPGGLCTAWKRRGYTFDGCIHHLGGSSPRSKLYRIWGELGALRDKELVFHDDLVRVETAEGQAFTVYTDLDRLEHHMKELSPADAPAIDRYIRAARFFTHFDLFSLPIATPAEMIQALPLMPALIQWSKVNLNQYAARFRDPLLRQAFPTIQYDFPALPMSVHLNFLSCCHNQTLSWPIGGSLGFARAIERRYSELGGEVHYRSRVAKVLTEDNKAVGVRLADGTEHRSDVVISAADGHATIFDMLDGQYADDRIRAYYDAVTDSGDMSLIVNLGVARDMTDEPHALTCFLEEPITLMGKARDRLNIEVFNFDPTLAPTGKTPVKVPLATSYAYWKDLAADRARYDESKQQIAEAVIGQLDKRFPGLASQVEVIDVSTPLTIERYTGNWRGQQAWPPKGMISTILKGLTRTLPGLDNFYMAGQWGEGMGGLSTAALAGRRAIKALCKRDQQQFVSQP